MKLKVWGAITAVVTVTAVTLALTSCGKAAEPFHDAPGSSVVNDKPMDKVLMSDGFSNVGTKCDHGNRLYVAFHSDSAYAAIAVVPQDPTCR